MDETDSQGSDVGFSFEEAEWHHRVLREIPFVEEEEDSEDDAENQETDDGGGRPGEAHAAVFEAEQEHDCTRRDCNDANPIDGLKTGYDGGFGGFNVEEEEDDNKCDSIKGN